MKLGIALLVPCALFAQMHDNRDQELSCQSGNRYGNGRRTHRCDLREQTVASTGRLAVDPGQNGGVTIKGWLRNDVLVRSRVDVWEDSDSKASAVMGEVKIQGGNGNVSTTGPSNFWHGGWSVSFEIFVPRKTSVTARAFNGGVRVLDIEGSMDLKTNNGGVQLERIAGDVYARTTNGGVHADLTGSRWQGRQLDLETTNGGITLSLPANYSAQIEAGTVNGRVASEFPMTVSGWLSRRRLEGKIGSGGPLIRLSTINGGINLRRG